MKYSRSGIKIEDFIINLVELKSPIRYALKIFDLKKGDASSFLIAIENVL